jgi:chromosome segregation ATPase
VVGPNGSGKSNVIDAMLFVFGRRAKQVKLDPGFKHCRDMDLIH